jgi:NAD(P)-dependent dehydrogenase (short-subunit alcohol dehydrogenase family)
MDILDGRTAIVTGGAKGIGIAYVEALAGAGATVVVADIVDGTEVARATEAKVPGARVIDRPTDVSDEASVKGLVEEVMAETGRIDVLVNNAAVFSTLPVARFDEIDVDLWDKVMAVNVRGMFLVSKHVAPRMIAQGSGKIINISSGTAYKGMPFMLHYVTSKGAVLAFTRALSRELGDHGICVNTIAPGLVMSDSIVANEEHIDAARDKVVASRAIKRDAYPKDVVGALLFLASPASDFITGQTIAVDGGSINT